jgi:hypothetical protein
MPHSYAVVIHPGTDSQKVHAYSSDFRKALKQAEELRADFGFEVDVMFTTASGELTTEF